NKKYKETERITFRLSESIRTPNGPRQRTILNLKGFSLPIEKWKILADTIEAFLKDQPVLYLDPEIEQLALHYSTLIREKRLREKASIAVVVDEKDCDFHEVDVKSLKNQVARTVGAEHVGLSVYKELELDKFFQNMGFSKHQENVAALSIIGRLVNPASENSTRTWAQKISGLDSLLGCNFADLSNNSLYRIADKIYEHKDALEKHLSDKEKDLFNLQEKMVFYDLTNTYLEGNGIENAKAMFGRSKEKRSDCRLLTLGLIIDEHGFPKASRLMPGNQYEPDSLINMIAQLEGIDVSELEKTKGSKKNQTVIMDAGISIERNLKMLEEYGYDYICVARTKPIPQSEIEKAELKEIHTTKNNSIEVKLFESEKENILYCHSLLKSKKEQAMLDKFKKKFEEELEATRLSLAKPHGTKKYEKVIEKIGRIRERNSAISRYYEIKLTRDPKSNKVADITWNAVELEKQNFRFSGSYFLKTSRRDLDEESLWNIYSTLTMVEAAFRSLKSELAFRPVYHRKENRADSHLFIAVIAYHLLNTIRTKLKQQDLHISWEKIREIMNTQVAVTSEFRTRSGNMILIRQSTEPEIFHSEIYKALNIDPRPFKQRIAK
ncbi:IS1634 family transposase, partial [Maridesulfovibrio ferrireducens]|uniref:IS1634 family transposase n=1 Tax=Maridesulfovibrio ferrireducens TaxID=246191 RepID=UPI001A2C3A65